MTVPCRLFIVATLLALLFVPVTSTGKTLHIMGEDAAPPYMYMEYGKKKGIDYDIIVEAARRMHIPVHVDLVPWKRMYAALENGSCDAGSAFFYIPEREAFVIYINPPLHHSTYSVFVRQGNEFSYTSPTNLFGKRVGVTRGYRLNKEFNDAVERGDIRAEEGNSISSNIKKVAAGRLDCMVSNLDATLLQLQHDGLLHQVVPLPTPVMEARAVHLVFSKAGSFAHDPAFIQRLEHTLENMKDDGTFQKIYQRYALPSQ